MRCSKLNRPLQTRPPIPTAPHPLIPPTLTRPIPIPPSTLVVPVVAVVVVVVVVVDLPDAQPHAVRDPSPHPAGAVHVALHLVDALKAIRLRGPGVPLRPQGDVQGRLRGLFRHLQLGDVVRLALLHPHLLPLGGTKMMNVIVEGPLEE